MKISLCLTLSILAFPAWSVTSSINEIQYQGGDLLNPFTRQKASTDIITLQHASQWDYGSHFFFVDFLNDDTADKFNDQDVYAEFYSHVSLGKTFELNLPQGILKDVSVSMGVNYGADANVLKYLPGVQLSLDVPAFRFFTILTTAYLDDSQNPQSDSYMIDTAWNLPFTAFKQKFSLEGHLEYMASRENETTGEPVSAWILAQPQLRWDMGYSLFNRPQQLFVGMEYQYWKNKLGVQDANEQAAQLLLVWRL